MITTSETAVTLATWALTAVGGFFGLRAYFRKRREKKDGKTTEKENRHE